MINKKIAAVVLATALSIGTVSTASISAADPGRKGGGAAQISAVLSGLVSSGTITQAQADAIAAAMVSATPKMKPMKDPFRNGFGKNSVARELVITSTLGITSEDLKAARLAGTSLAILAGDKKAELITALVDFETTEIDAAVTNGKLTADQATAKKAGLNDRVTSKVESAPGKKLGGMDKEKNDKKRLKSAIK